jgi:hypothetical protein
MATIVQCNCGAGYKRTEAKFLVPHTGLASCKVCGATLEAWLESTPMERVLFSTRIQNALRAADLKTDGEVREISDETPISLPDFGKGSLSDPRKKLGLPSTDGVRPLSRKPA